MVERDSRHLAQVGGQVPPEIIRLLSVVPSEGDDGLEHLQRDVLLPFELLFFAQVLSAGIPTAINRDRRMNADFYTGREFVSKLQYYEEWVGRVEDLRDLGLDNDSKACIFSASFQGTSPHVTTNLVEFVIKRMRRAPQAKRLKNYELKTVISVDAENIDTTKVVFAFVQKSASDSKDSKQDYNNKPSEPGSLPDFGVNTDGDED